jgi:hypothetical protein
VVVVRGTWTISCVFCIGGLHDYIFDVSAGVPHRIHEACLYARVHKHTHTHIHTHTHTHTHTLARARARTRVRAHTQARTHSAN